MTTDAVVADQPRTADALVGRLFEASLGMLDVLSVYLGDRLGLYRPCGTAAPRPPRSLAARGGIDARYAREWLEQQAATGILDVAMPARLPEDRGSRCPMPTSNRC